LFLKKRNSGKRGIPACLLEFSLEKGAVRMKIACPQNFSCAKYEILLTAGPSGLLLPPYKGSTLRGGELIHAGKGVVFGLGQYEIRETGRPVPPEGSSWDQS
jgi:hypothetical protein